MNIVQLQHLLDLHGPDPATWPEAPSLRADAERLIAADPAAADARERALRLEALIARQMAAAPQVDDPATQASASRVMAALAARPLPPQHRAWRWWPAELAAFDFAPAWPRIAVLASVGILGFAIGLAALDTGFGAGLSVTRTANADTDLSAIVFEPEPVTGLRP
jgi:hypothetical protein